MPRWLRTIYSWIAGRRRTQHGRRPSTRRSASYPARSSRPSRSSTPNHGSRSTTPPPAMMKSVNNERVSMPPPRKPVQPLSHDIQATAHAQPAQILLTGPGVVREPLRRQQTLPAPSAYSMGYVTFPGQQQQTWYYVPVSPQPPFHPQIGAPPPPVNPFIAPFEHQPTTNVKLLTGGGYAQSHYAKPRHSYPQAQVVVKQPHALPEPPAPTSTAVVRRRPPPTTRHVRTMSLPPSVPKTHHSHTPWRRYRNFWERSANGVPAGTVLTFRNIPWPMINPPKLPTSLTVSAVKAFLLSPHHSKTMTPLEVVEEARLAWYPPSFKARFGAFVADADKETVERAVNFLRGTLILLYEEVGNFDEPRKIRSS